MVYSYLLNSLRLSKGLHISEEQQLANFEQAFDKMMEDEGGYVLHEVQGDRGGQTYAGIARKMHPKWEGWQHIDYQETPPTQLVRDFYKENFWNKIKGDDLVHDVIASSLFNFAVNAGVHVSIKLAQICVKTAPDGVIGPKTISALNQANPELFVAYYALAKIARYRDIVTRDRSQLKFLLGWVSRTLKL
jgi:lysozyme family protein